MASAKLDEEGAFHRISLICLPLLKPSFCVSECSRKWHAQDEMESSCPTPAKNLSLKTQDLKPFLKASAPRFYDRFQAGIGGLKQTKIHLHDLSSYAMEVEDGVTHSSTDPELTTRLTQAVETPNLPHAVTNESGASGQAKKPGGRPKSFVWQYYTQHTDANFKSKRCEVSCNFCDTRMLSRVEQMEAHLAHNCPRCPADIKDHMRDRIFAAKELSKAKKEALERGEQIARASSSLMQQPLFSPAFQSLAKRQKLEGPRDTQHPIPLRLRFPQVRPGSDPRHHCIFQNTPEDGLI